VYVSVGSDEALYLLATCYYRSGKPQRAYSVLSSRGFPTSQCRYLAAQCCLQLNRCSLLSSSIMALYAAKEVDIIYSFNLYQSIFKIIQDVTNTF